MKSWLWIIGVALTWLPAGQGSELRITAFEGGGRLPFQELPAAASYRVEWTTNLLSAL